MQYSPRYVYSEQVKHEKYKDFTENYDTLSAARLHKRNPTFDINSIKFSPILQELKSTNS